MKTVEMRMAYAWWCEECGRENYGSPVVAELSPEERQEMIELGEDPATGNWVTIPHEVECSYCGAKFETKHYSDMEDDNDDE